MVWGAVLLCLRSGVGEPVSWVACAGSGTAGIWWGHCSPDRGCSEQRGHAGMSQIKEYPRSAPVPRDAFTLDCGWILP